MSNKVYFTPGPSQLYPEVGSFIQEALENDFGSISHRSPQYVEIHKKTVEELRKLINLPNNFHVFFLGSASEAWERIFLNFVRESSFHFTNGSFSKKFHQYGTALGKNAQKHEVPFGEGFDLAQANIPSGAELITFTQNETSSGVHVPLKDIYTVRKQYPQSLIAVDMVSSLPYPNIDFTKVDTAFFSVQKCFGLPAGLGVWLVNDRCIEKAQTIKSEGESLGAHHDVLELLKRSEGNQTPSTPNVLNIYLLGRVAEAMNKKTVEVIRQETDEKYEMLHQFISECSFLDEAVKEADHRSKTVVVANTTVPASELNKHLASYDVAIGSGYGKHKTTQIRIANFPAHSIEDTKKLIKALKEYKA